MEISTETNGKFTHDQSNGKIVESFIQSIWNARELHRIDEFIADDYNDYSFLPAIPPTRDGLKTWIENTSMAFEHKTTIESAVTENDQVAVRISFEVRHTGKWRNIEPTFRVVSVKGFRFFRLKNKKIIQHWALIDGEALQTALTGEYQGCVIPKS